MGGEKGNWDKNKNQKQQTRDIEEAGKEELGQKQKKWQSL